ncbi:MAG: DUF1858 domain-containing protein [Minisyncoccales bacterium]
MGKITKNTKLAEILKNPKMVKILEKYNLPCLGCVLAKFEMDRLTIGQICQMYQLNLEALLKELNKL